MRNGSVRVGVVALCLAVALAFAGFFMETFAAPAKGKGGGGGGGGASKSPAPPVNEAVTPPGDPVLEDPTYLCIGAWWIVGGDASKARVEMEYRAVGENLWKKSMPMFRVRKGDTVQVTHEAEINPGDAQLFAGSVVNLTPGTEYELKLTLVKPGGGSTERILKAHTRAEPVEPADAKVCHVVPGKGGGDGSGGNPFKGLEAAEAAAQPGTIFLVHKGVYSGSFKLSRSGEPNAPIIWRGAGDGEAVIEGNGEQTGVVFPQLHDVRVEKLSVRNFSKAMQLIDCRDIVVRRCNISGVKYGIYSGATGKTLVRNVVLSDNHIDGSFKWDGVKAGDKEEYRGIQITGTGCDVCYNWVRGFKDGIDTFPSKYCAAIDFHHNDVIDCKDDGTEMDFSERNTRCFMNRYVNVDQGISFQPIFGGPTYVFRNAIYNIHIEPFKLHHVGGVGKPENNWPSGAILYHNTTVKKDAASCLLTPAPVYNCVYRNNLFVGGGKCAFEFDPPMEECDFDYDGVAGGPWQSIMHWNKGSYQTLAEIRAKAPVEKHMTVIEGDAIFASGIGRPTDWLKRADPTRVDLRLKRGCAAVDAGEVLPGFNDGFTGKAPDIGAYEVGQELPQYGPRPEKPASAVAKKPAQAPPVPAKERAGDTPPPVPAEAPKDAPE